MLTLGAVSLPAVIGAPVVAGEAAEVVGAPAVVPVLKIGPVHSATPLTNRACVACERQP